MTADCTFGSQGSRKHKKNLPPLDKNVQSPSAVGQRASAKFKVVDVKADDTIFDVKKGELSESNKKETCAEDSEQALEIANDECEDD